MLDGVVTAVRRTNAVKFRGQGHPLALDKAELATLLREALFGPGWASEGRGPTPPGCSGRPSG
uniref:hypothetical protein n=1 Tax=Streptomyces chartreusis TaxID=1969 RepID=UPI003F495C0F